MEMHFEELLEKVTDFIKSEAKTETIIGNSFKLGEFNCVPVIKVGLGFGTGGGEGEGNNLKQGKGTGGAAGAGIGLAPIGFLVSNGDDISFISAEVHSGLESAFEKVPDLISKYMDQREKEKTVA